MAWPVQAGEVRRLQRRVRKVQGNHGQAMTTLTPVGSSHPSGTGATPMTMPTNLVTYLPVESYPWGTATYQDLQPTWFSDGPMIAAKDAGSWGNLHAAGRP